MGRKKDVLITQKIKALLSGFHFALGHLVDRAYTDWDVAMSAMFLLYSAHAASSPPSKNTQLTITVSRLH